MSESQTKVLLAGATGMLGARTAQALLDSGRADLRLLVRSASLQDPRKKALVSGLVSKGARLVEGDLADSRSLREATGGVEVVVSAVQGGRETIVDGQLALLDAAKRNGVRRILPSDFAVDLFEVPYGRHPFLNLRREADEVIAASGLEHVHVLNGGFMDTMLEPFIGMVDLERGEGRFWGTGDEPIDLTTVEDTARFTAEAALDRELPSGKFAVAGEVTTFKRAIGAIATASGRPLTLQSLGTVEELVAWIDQQVAAGRPLFDYLAGQYLWTMVSGIGKLRDLRNGRYPHLRTETMEAFAARALASRSLVS